MNIVTMFSCFIFKSKHLEFGKVLTTSITMQNPVNYKVACAEPVCANQHHHAKLREI